MKTSPKLLILLFIVGLSSCQEAHFLKDSSYRKQVMSDFDLKRQQLPHGDLFTVIDDASVSAVEREALCFLYAYMPLADVVDKDGRYYLEQVRLTEHIRQEMPWGRLVPDLLYRHFVLPIRVNNENLDDSRRVFYAELRDRVKGLSMADAILEVNHWCHEKVVYRPSDARTTSPLATVSAAFGRCGEESTFTVAALRAVGIPARQVYTPRWAHTDDNHAWVEAWADGKWYFMGACEPEPVLDLGWFNAPASRGMLMHTRVFGRYNGPEEVMQCTPNFTEINVIDNYAKTARATVKVVDADNMPVAGARVEFKIYNYAEFYTVATKTTGNDGTTFLTAGQGDMLVWASAKGRFGLNKLSFGKQDELILKLDKKEGDPITMDFDIVPPSENAALPLVTAEQRAENDRRLAHEDTIRRAYEATMMTVERARQLAKELNVNEESGSRILVDSRGNYANLITFLRQTPDNQRAEALNLLSVLSQKDWRDVTLPVLIDHVLHTVQKPADLDADLYHRYVMNPRVANEMITPYKKYLTGLPESQSLHGNPQALIEWCSQQITVNDSINSLRLLMSPEGVWRARVADTSSRQVFFVSFARALGIPARIDKVTGKVQYLSDKHWVDVQFGAEESVRVAETGRLTMTFEPTKVVPMPKYSTHFTLAKYDPARSSFRLLDFGDSQLDMGGGASLQQLLGSTLDTGYYMLTTGTRMASGAVLSQVRCFSINKGETTTVPLVLRASADQVQVIGSFNSESLFQPMSSSSASCGVQSFLQACGRGYFIVAVLGVNQEPTNHILKDIAALGKDFEQWGRKMVFLFPTEEQYRKYKPDEFKGLPSTIIYGVDVNHVQQQIAAEMKLGNAAQLPMIIIADTFNRVVFVSQGYTIGMGEQLMKVIHGL